MRISFFIFLIISILSGCSGSEEMSNRNSVIENGIYMGYFEYQNKNYWYEIEFMNDQYIEWPSGGAMFQKSYGCLTVGTWSAGNGKLTFNMGSYKMPGYPETCVQDMLIPGQYSFYDVLKSDSLVFEKGSN